MENAKEYEIRNVSVRLCEEAPVYACLPLTTPDQVVDFLERHIGDRDREYLVMIHLDTRRRVKSVTTVSEGTVNDTVTTMREIYKTAVLENAESVILAHNHPSGITDPSDDDISLTRRAALAGALMGIRLLDHLIVSRGFPSFSFHESRPDVLDGAAGKVEAILR